MQQCEFCGSELPINARFCGHCGRTPGSAVAGPTEISDSPTVDLPPLNAPAALGGQSQPAPGNEEQEEEKEERRRPGILLDLPFPGVLAGEGQPSVGNVPMVQGTPQISGVPMVQGTPSSLSGAPNASAFSQSGAPNATGLSQSTTPNASAFSQSAVPSAPPPVGQPQAPFSPGGPPVSPTGSSTPLPQTGVPQPPTQHHHHERHHRRASGKLHTGRSGGSAPKWLIGSVPKWLLLVIIGLVVATGSAAAAIGLSHGRLLGIGGTSSALSNHTGSTQSSHFKATVGTTSGTKTANGLSTADFTFSGGIAGHMTITSFIECGISGGTSYAVSVNGTVGGQKYFWSASLSTYYTGPGTYTQIESLAITPSADQWLGSSGRMTIASDGKSGTLDIPLPRTISVRGTGTLPPAHVTGSWICGQLWGSQTPN